MRIALATGLLFTTLAAAQAQTQPAPGCTLSKPDHYACDKDQFLRLLARSTTVRIDTERMDLFGKKQMSNLLSQLGKQTVMPDQHADLVFELSWVDRSGRIDVGPSDVAVGRLNVYEPSRGQGDRSLVWVETFDSGEQTPWPAVTQALIQQFRRDIVEK